MMQRGKRRDLPEEIIMEILLRLPEEIITEILLRLPARTLASLRSVCSSWRNLISAADFSWNHLRRSCLLDPNLTPLRIVYCSLANRSGVKCCSIGFLSVQSIMSNNPTEPTNVECFSGQGHCKIIGSCNGLLCLMDNDNDQNLQTFLWNPCTGFILKTPQIRAHYVCLPSFCYDHLSDSYKDYGIIKNKGASGFEYSSRIYTLGQTSSWKRIDDFPFSPFDYCSIDKTYGVFFGNSRVSTINWSAGGLVLYFDLSKESYGHFKLPNTDPRDFLPGKRLCVLRNCFSVCYENTKTKHWILWQMKEYGDAQSWTKLAMIPFHPHPHPHFYYTNDMSCSLQPLYLSKSNLLLALFRFFKVCLTISQSFKIVLCNLNDCSSVDFPVIENSDDGIETDLSMAYIYHENLVSPNGLGSNSSKIPLRFIKPKRKPIVS